MISRVNGGPAPLNRGNLHVRLLRVGSRGDHSRQATAVRREREKRSSDDCTPFRPVARFADLETPPYPIFGGNYSRTIEQRLEAWEDSILKAGGAWDALTADIRAMHGASTRSTQTRALRPSQGVKW